MYKKQDAAIRKYLGHHIIDKLLKAKVNFMVAGGACTSVFSGQPINDIDMFFASHKDAIKGVDIIRSDGYYESKFSSPSAISWRSEDGHKLQTIDKVFGPPKEILENFDFTVTMCALVFLPSSPLDMMGLLDEKYYSDQSYFQMDENFLYHLAERLLVWNVNGKFPIATMFRVMKYKDKGYKVTGVELIKLALGINQLKIDTYADLKEQLEGIDTAMLKSLTDKFLDKGEADFKFNEFLTELNEYLDKVYMEL